ncbi:phage tail tape measure protein [Beijerinckia indica]|uniref:phage tail tape measure protein n=1 Tax=Beijerinckia indica TaxID=533 RepID=UPI0003026429|nr:phage tail tape measure protein [Beijerinckia indica]
MGAKFGFASGHTGGFRNETMFGILAALSRAGYHGDEAGVATRAIATKLVAPTAKGLDALSAMGINHNDFTKMPGGMSPEALDSMQKRRFGVSLNASQKSRLGALFANDAIVGNRDDFIAQTTEIMADSFAKNKKGKLSAQDANKIGKLTGDFYKMAIESVDVEGLLRAILEAHPTLAQANALFTSQHGGKVTALSENAERTETIIHDVSNVHEGFAEDIGNKRNEGVSGSFLSLEAAMEALKLRIGEVNQGLLKFSADLASDTLKKIANLPDDVLQKGSLGVAGAGALSGLAGLVSFVSGDGLANAAKAGIGTMSKGLTSYLLYEGGKYGIDLLLNQLPHPQYPAGYDPKQIRDRGAWGDLMSLLKNMPGWTPPAQKPTPPAPVEAAPHVDMEQIDVVAQKSTAAGDALAKAINQPLALQVDTSALDAVLNKVSQVKAGLASIGTQAANVQIPSFGRTQRGSFTSAGSQGE